jgi:hypothetical protein
MNQRAPGYEHAMDAAALAGYVNEHLTGAEGALRVVSRLRDVGDDVELVRFMDRLEADIEQERAVLRDVLAILDADPSLIGRTVGTVGGMVMRAREAISDTPTRLEDLEALAIGVWGKRLLWGALVRVAAHDDRFDAFNLDGLVATAEEQERALLRLRADELDRELEDGIVS